MSRTARYVPADTGCWVHPLIMCVCVPPIDHVRMCSGFKKWFVAPRDLELGNEVRDDPRF